MDYNNQEEIKMNNNNINNNINNSKNEYNSFNSQMLMNSLNQPLKKGEIPRESGDTIEIIEKKYFQYRENSKDLIKSDYKIIYDSQEEEKFENEENPFYQPKISEENNNNNLNGLIMNENNNRDNNNNINNNNISNNNKISYINNNNNNILNEKSYIYNINGNLYSFLGEKNFVSEDNIIISDLNKYNDFQK